MDVLRNLFGNLSTGVIRLAVVAGTLALAYLFILKPILDTTETISTSINQSVRQSLNTTGGADLQRQIRRSIAQANRQAELATRRPGVSSTEVPTTVQITRTVRGLTPRQARRLSRCIRRAGSRPAALNACFDRFSRR
jgi:hypothetical protein